MILWCSLILSMVSVWATTQRPSYQYSYGSVMCAMMTSNDIVCRYERVSVLAVFSLTVVLILGALSLLKHRYVRTTLAPHDIV